MLIVTTLRKKLENIGLGVIRSSELKVLRSNSLKLQNLKTKLFFLTGSIFADSSAKEIEMLIALAEESTSQICQDLFVIHILKGKKNGYFVDFGATNGIRSSNTFLLESQFFWTGILAEPARMWHSELMRNRKSQIDTRCVWSESNANLMFRETEVGEFSTISQFSNSDGNQGHRNISKEYEVMTVSLNDLLLEHNAPKYIDYLSIDTEGSELDILSNFDFSKYKFGVITCEHNFTENRSSIHDLLSSNGYVRVFENVSLFDDWYVNSDLLASSK